MTPQLRDLRGMGELSPLDDHFARALGRMAGEERADVLLATALASRHVGNGHVCLDLARLAEGPPPLAEDPPAMDDTGADPAALAWPELSAWLADLRSSGLVLDLTSCEPEPGGERRPLVLDSGARLYLRRYWEHQSHLAKLLHERAAEPLGGLDEAALQEGLRRLFGDPAAGSEDAAALASEPQRRAAETAVRRNLCIISGGPGTGKTSTVAKILVLVAEQAAAKGEALPRMQLLAPTGKAAAILAQSLQQSLAGLACDDAIRAAIPTRASTIHRALGSRGAAGRRFRHDAANPLVTDLLLVDEASMVDLVLMTRLLDAVPPGARVVLLGDRDQLASVEAGSVMGDICNVSDVDSQSDSGTEVEGTPDPESARPIAGSVVVLTHSYRYAADSGIGALAHAVNGGDADAALDLLRDPDRDDIELLPPPPSRGLGAALQSEVLAGYAPFLEAAAPHERLAALARFRVLAPHRRGAAGVEALNRDMEAVLAAHAGLRPEGEFYSGRPVGVTRNDYELEIYNGDVGVLLRRPAATGGGTSRDASAFFSGPDGQERWISPLRLAALETVFAMTVHKSQGSEFDAVAFVLAEKPSALVSRELVYTAVSRGRNRVALFASPEALREAIGRRIERASGLREALWG